jgi:hypothetical protein
VLLYRAGRRAEALVITSVGLVYLLYNSGYYLPYGGQVPGPRFLITALPFLALPLALSFRRFPALTIGLAAVSATCMAIPTMVKPFVSGEGDTGQWMRLLEHHDFQGTIVTLTGTQGWVTVIPFIALLLVAGVLAAAASPRGRLAWRSLAGAATAVGTWTVLAIFAPRVLRIDHHAELKIVSAGDPTAVHEKYGSHPISHLALAALGVALITLAVAAVWSRIAPTRREPVPAVRRQPMAAAPASIA